MVFIFLPFLLQSRKTSLKFCTVSWPSQTRKKSLHLTKCLISIFRFLGGRRRRTDVTQVGVGCYVSVHVAWGVVASMSRFPIFTLWASGGVVVFCGSQPHQTAVNFSLFSVQKRIVKVRDTYRYLLVVELESCEKLLFPVFFLDAERKVVEMFSDFLWQFDRGR